MKPEPAIIYGCGQANLDRDHDILFALLDRLRVSLDGGADSGPSICTELRAYADAHFEHEEQLMDRYHYPGTVAHKQGHQTFRDQLEDLSHACTGRRVAPLPLVNAVESWIHTHMLDVDARLAVFLEKCHIEPCHGDAGVFADSDQPASSRPTAWQSSGRMTLEKWQFRLR